MVRTSEDVSTVSVSCRDRGLKFVFSAAGGCATMVDDAGLLRRGEQRTHTQLQVLMLQAFPWQGRIHYESPTEIRKDRSVKIGRGEKVEGGFLELPGRYGRCPVVGGVKGTRWRDLA